MERLLNGALLALVASAAIDCAAAELPDVAASIAAGYVDAGHDTSYLDAGFGKTPYGRDDDGPAWFDGYIVLNTRLGADWDAALTLSGSSNLSPALGVSEATLTYRPLPDAGLRYRVKLGAFRPPVSFEHTAEGWTTPYTVLASALNSWIGEEVGALGAEFKVASDPPANPSGRNWDVFAAGYYGNDPVGTLLAWDGWNFWNGQTRYGDRIAMPDLPLFAVANDQSRYAEPYVETDGRPGYYVGGTLEQTGVVRIRALYYDNRTDPNSHNGGQFGWRTRFTSVAAQANLPFDCGLIVQWLGGSSYTWDAPPPMGRTVDMDFDAAFVELTKAFRNQRFTVRYDAFGVSDHDAIPIDPNGETGRAWTASYQWHFARQWTVALERLWVDGHRTARASAGLDPNYDDDVTLATLRWQI